MSLLIKGVTNFLGLTDTPAAFTGEGGKGAQVNVAENALEFASLPINLLDGIYQQFEQKLLEDWVETVDGTGTTTYSAFGYLQVATGAVAGGTAIRSYNPILAEVGAANEIDWDDELILQFIIKFYTEGLALGDKIGFARIAKGVASADILGDLGVGFKHERNGEHLVLESHDGVARQFTDLGIGSWHERLFGTGGDGTILRVHHRPNGAAEVRFYELNAAGGFDLIGTHTDRVPAGLSGAWLSIAANNKTTASNYFLSITHAQLYRPIPV